VRIIVAELFVLGRSRSFHGPTAFFEQTGFAVSR